MATKRQIIAKLSTEDLLALAGAAERTKQTPAEKKRAAKAVRLIKKLEGNK